MKDLFSLKQKVAIVTGGAHGIGLTYAISYLEHGGKVAICDVNQKYLDEAEKKLEKYGDRLITACVDVTSEKQIRQFVEDVLKRFGQIDILVNNAGVLIRKLPEEMNGEDWDFVMDVNVKGTFLFSIEVGKWFIKESKRGKIINISSQTGIRAADRRLAYCTSKAAVIQFTKVLASEWGKYGINVNAIAPGYIKTDMNKDLRANENLYQIMKDEVPMGDFGSPEDIVGTLLYLSSEGSDYITGQTIFVDGGLVTK